MTEYSISSQQQPVAAPNRLDDPIFTLNSNNTHLTIESADFFDPIYSEVPNNNSTRIKRANENADDNYGSGDEGEKEPSRRLSREEEEEGGGDNDFAEKTTIEEGLILGGPTRDKREEDCKNDQKIEKISDNLERVKADVEKISAHIFGAQQIKSNRKQTDGTARFPICFFQPDPTSLSGQTDGNYFTGQVSGGDTNPVTCVFVTPPSAPAVAEKFEGKIVLPLPHSARQNGGGNFKDENGK